MEEEWVAEAAESLERLTRDPMADAVRGSVRILSITPPARRGRFQTCTVELALEGAGIDGETLTDEFVLDRRHWPEPGRVLPARISRERPRRVEVGWDALAR